jgi:PAS domain S-box-containing protein
MFVCDGKIVNYSTGQCFKVFCWVLWVLRTKNTQQNTSIPILPEQLLKLFYLKFPGLSHSITARIYHPKKSLMKPPVLLIVDSDNQLTRSLEQNLCDQFQVHSANSGRDALKIIEHHVVDLILIDPLLPDMTGLAVLQTVHAQNNKMTGLLLSAQPDPTMLVEAINLGYVRGYIAKPIVETELRARLQAALSSWQAGVQQEQSASSTVHNEHVLQLFVKYAPAAIAMFDRDMRYLAFSHRYLRDYSLSQEDILGRSHYDIFPEIPKRWKDIHRRCLAGAVEMCPEDPFPRIDGTVDWVRWEIRPWYETGGEIGGILLFSEVITDRKEMEDRLRASLLEKETLLREVHHRVKNNLASILGLLEMERMSTHDSAASVLLAELANRIQAMATIHQMLYRTDNLSKVNFQNYLVTFIEQLKASYAAGEFVTIRIDAEGVELSLDTAVPCGLIINELVTNALKYAFDQAAAAPGKAEQWEIVVSLKKAQGQYLLQVSDNGAGLPEGLNWRETETLGLRLVRMLGEHQLHGKSELSSDSGINYSLHFHAD